MVVIYIDCHVSAVDTESRNDGRGRLCTLQNLRYIRNIDLQHLDAGQDTVDVPVNGLVSAGHRLQFLSFFLEKGDLPGHFFDIIYVSSHFSVLLVKAAFFC